MRLDTKSLQFRVLLTVLLVTILGLSIASVVTFQMQHSRMIATFRSFQESYLNAILNGVVASVNNKDTDFTPSKFLRTIKHSSVYSLRILTYDGVVRYSMKATEEGTRFPQDVVNSWKTSDSTFFFEDHSLWTKQKLTSAKRIKNSVSCYSCHSSEIKYLGFIEMENDLTKLHASIIKTSLFNIAITTATILLILIAVYFIHLKVVFLNFSRFQTAIGKIEEGNFETVLAPEKTREFGKLALAFNQMIQRLHEMRQELERSHSEQLVRADKLASIGELAAGMAHEVKNPIAGIAIAVKAILDKNNLDAKSKLVHEEILRQIKRVDVAVNSLLTYARPHEPNLIEYDIRKVIQNAIKIVSPQAKEAAIEIINKEEPGFSDLVIDPLLIEQVIVNILLNAVQAIPTRGFVNIESFCIRDSGVFKVTIQDQGIGIHSDDLNSIFKPFFTKKHRGTGLGLAICKNIIEQHHGTIVVDSELGVGTRFTISLPVVVSPKEHISKEDSIGI